MKNYKAAYRILDIMLFREPKLIELQLIELYRTRAALQL
jgi:hypothetical protein